MNGQASTLLCANMVCHQLMFCIQSNCHDYLVGPDYGNELVNELCYVTKRQREKLVILSLLLVNIVGNLVSVKSNKKLMKKCIHLPSSIRVYAEK